MATSQPIQTLEWGTAAHSADERRRLRNAVVASLVCHVGLVALLGFAPRSAPSPIASAISVDLVAALPGAAPRPAAAKTEVASPPRPVAVPAPPPPPKPQAKILPKHAPDPVAKAPAKPQPEPQRQPRPKELSYDDALARLRDEAGEPRDAPESETGEVDAPSDDELLALARPGQGVRVSPEEAAWMLATKRHIRGVWITPPEFLNRGLSTELRVELAAGGEVIGSPEVLRSSGDPFADDNAVRALLKASPLPAPPEAGRRTFIFEPEERS